jgi:tetratricopeptide (TPR) repeat protein
MKNTFIILTVLLFSCTCPEFHIGRREYNTALLLNDNEHFKKAKKYLIEALMRCNLNKKQKFEALVMIARCWAEDERFENATEAIKKAVDLYDASITYATDVHFLVLTRATYSSKEADKLIYLAGKDLPTKSAKILEAIDFLSSSIGELLYSRTNMKEYKFMPYFDLHLVRFFTKKAQLLLLHLKKDIRTLREAKHCFTNTKNIALENLKKQTPFNLEFEMYKNHAIRKIKEIEIELKYLK